MITLSGSCISQDSIRYRAQLIFRVYEEECYPDHINDNTPSIPYGRKEPHKREVAMEEAFNKHILSKHKLRLKSSSPEMGSQYQNDTELLQRIHDCYATYTLLFYISGMPAGEFYEG
jgi:hypothetical protein